MGTHPIFARTGVVLSRSSVRYTSMPHCPCGVYIWVPQDERYPFPDVQVCLANGYGCDRNVTTDCVNEAAGFASYQGQSIDVSVSFSVSDCGELLRLHNRSSYINFGGFKASETEIPLATVVQRGAPTPSSRRGSSRSSTNERFEILLGYIDAGSDS